jgi:tetratricopeptide (TPR) repeat protein
VDQSTESQNQSTQNHHHLRRLVMALKASYGRLNLLIAICDNWHYRDQLIRTYEGELQAENVECDRLTLDRQDPSLKHSLQTLVETTPSVISPPAIVTVLGADELLGIRLDADKSAQEHFFFSVQWTREALRDFSFPIVLWLTPTIAAGLAQHAPDFWSWRGGVFEFSQPLNGERDRLEGHQIYTPQSLAHLEIKPDRFSTDPQELEQQIYTLRHHDPDSPLLGSLWHSVGNAYQERRQYSQAETAYRQALALREKHLGADHPDTAQSLNNLAELYREQGCYSEAEPLYKRSLLIRESQLGIDHPDTAQSLNNLALLYQSQGRYSEAEPLYKRSLSIREQQLGADHPDTAESLNNLAGLYKSQGRYSEAEPLYKRSLLICEQHLGIDHPHTAESLNNLAGLYYSQGHYGEAEPLFKRSLSIREQQLGADHPDTAQSLNNLAYLYKSQGRYSEAEPLYKRALTIAETVLGSEHPTTVILRDNYEALQRQL